MLFLFSRSVDSLPSPVKVRPAITCSLLRYRSLQIHTEYGYRIHTNTATIQASDHLWFVVVRVSGETSVCVVNTDLWKYTQRRYRIHTDTQTYSDNTGNCQHRVTVISVISSDTPRYNTRISVQIQISGHTVTQKGMALGVEIQLLAQKPGVQYRETKRNSNWPQSNRNGSIDEIPK